MWFIKKHFVRPPLVLLLLFAAHVSATPQPAPPGQPAVKDLNTPRDFPKIDSLEQWQARARNIREQILISSGLWPLPKKTPLNPHIFGKIERDGYSVEKVYFQTSPGFYLAGNLYRPLGRGKGPFPAILNPHGHWKEGRMADTKEGSISARCISFARQGMIAFSYDMVGFNDTHFADAQTNQPFYSIHRQFGAAKTDQLWNISLMGLQTWNSIRALDFLESLPDADRKRLACTGESGGGTQTYMLGAIDDRLAAQAPVVMVSHTMQGGCSCENMPGLRVEYSNMEIAAVAAPRPQILVAATGDWTKTTLTFEGPAIEHIYQLFGAQDRLRYVRFDFGHNYNQTSREAVYEWFGQWLSATPVPSPRDEGVGRGLGRGARSSQPILISFKEAPYHKEPDSALRVFPDGQLPKDAMTMEQFAESLKNRTQAQWRSIVPRNKRGLEKFKQIMLPAWQHTLQLDQIPLLASLPLPSQRGEGWPVLRSVFDEGGGEGSVRSPLVVPSKSSDNGPGETFVVLGIAAGHLDAKDSNSRTKIIRPLEDLNIMCFTIESPTNSHDQFSNFFTTYNRTALQEHVRNLVKACTAARDRYQAKRVVLCGIGRAGLAALLAAPAADAVIADCNDLNISSDETLLAPDLFCPGLRTIGTFEGAAMLAAPHPLLLHNTGSHFLTSTVRATYKAIGANANLRVESLPLSETELTKWISGPQPR